MNVAPIPLSDQNIAILFSYSAREDSENFRRLYALAELETSSNVISVKNLKSVPYQTVIVLPICPE